MHYPVLISILFLLASPVFAADYSIGPSASGVLTDSSIDKACTGRCLDRGGNQSLCDKICDEAVEEYMPEEAQEAIEEVVSDEDGGFDNVDFPCFKKCRSLGESFEECEEICTK